jgi:hypothetical protein
VRTPPAVVCRDLGWPARQQRGEPGTVLRPVDLRIADDRQRPAGTSIADIGYARGKRAVAGQEASATLTRYGGWAGPKEFGGIKGGPWRGRTEVSGLPQSGPAGARRQQTLWISSNQLRTRSLWRLCPFGISRLCEVLHRVASIPMPLVSPEAGGTTDGVVSCARSESIANDPAATRVLKS